MGDKGKNTFFNKLKNKLTKNNNTLNYNSEYAFSDEEIETINKENKKKLETLKEQTITHKNKDNTKKTLEVLSKLSNHEEPIDEIKEEPNLKEQPEETPTTTNQEITINNVVEMEIKPKPKQSYIALEPKYQQLIMDKWNEINLNDIEKDIIAAKDLLNHNYTITYADDTARFIHNIRKKYEVVICYLIGFNNEKQGIYDKTIISNNIDDEWKHLNTYIKILEKIRNFKMK